MSTQNKRKQMTKAESNRASLEDIDLAQIEADGDSAIELVLKDVKSDIEDRNIRAKHNSHSSYSTHGTVAW